MIEEVNEELIEESLSKKSLLWLIVAYYLLLIFSPFLEYGSSLHSIFTKEPMSLFTKSESIILMFCLFIFPIFYYRVKKKQANSQYPLRHLLITYVISLLFLTNFLVFSLLVPAVTDYSYLAYGYYLCLIILLIFVSGEYRCLKIMVDGKKKKKKRKRRFDNPFWSE